MPPHISARCLLLVLMMATASGCSTLFPKKAGASLAHFPAEAPSLGAAGPDASLWTLQGEPVRLSERVGKRPLVIQLGSYTCPVFRYRRFYMEPLYETYRGRVDFLVIYTQEAHPVGSWSPYRDEEWVSLPNRLTRVLIPQPPTLQARIERAAQTRTLLVSTPEYLVDGMDNAAWRSYGRAPSAAFLIDREGRVRLHQPWVEPKGLDKAIEQLLAETE
jgi:hypothetical protein